MSNIVTHYIVTVVTQVAKLYPIFMIEALITSKTRIKLLLKFFLNPSSTAYLRSLENEFQESTNGIRVELNRFESAGMLRSFHEGNKKMFRANTDHPLFSDLQNIVLKYVGIPKIIDTVVSRMGKTSEIYLTGDYAKGQDTGIIDLVFIGEINRSYLVTLVEKAEVLINRKIRFLVYTKDEWSKIAYDDKGLLIWNL